jgi:uncharacterized protein
MANSLLDQLQKTGLVDTKKAKQVVKDKRKQNKVQRKGKQPVVDHLQSELKQAKAEKIERDRQLNLARDEKSQRKAIAAQIKQLIEMNTITATGDQPFNFADGKNIKRIYVDEEQTGRLSRGVLAIVKLGDKYNMVPTPVADRIAERDPDRIIFKADKGQDITDEDDPYAEYKIPDDLNW